MRKILTVAVLTFFIFSFKWDDYRLYKMDSSRSTTYVNISSNYPKTVLLMWTSYCYYCIKELRKINQANFKYDNIKFYYVNLGEPRSRVEKTIKRFGFKKHIKDNIILDEKAALAEKFNIWGIPTYIFLRNGKQIYKSHFINKALVDEVFGERPTIEKEERIKTGNKSE